MNCPKCGEETTFIQYSSGGDGLDQCLNCGWVEDPTMVVEDE